MLNHCTSYGFNSAHANYTLFCQWESHEFLSCLTNSVKNIALCLSPEEKYLTDFFSESATAVVDFLCRDKGKNFQSKCIFLF